jgi:hypothetical protein
MKHLLSTLIVILALCSSCVDSDQKNLCEAYIKDIDSLNKHQMSELDIISTNLERIIKDCTDEETKEELEYYKNEIDSFVSDNEMGSYIYTLQEEFNAMFM